MTDVADKLLAVRKAWDDLSSQEIKIIRTDGGENKLAVAVANLGHAIAELPDPDNVFEIPDPDTVVVPPSVAKKSRMIRPFVLHPEETHLVIKWARQNVGIVNSSGQYTVEECKHIHAALAKLEEK